MKKVYVKEIAEFLTLQKIEHEVIGDKKIWIDDFSPLSSLESRKISWVKQWTEKNIKSIEGKKEVVIIGSMENAINPEAGECFILSENPKMCFYKILNEFFLPEEKNEIAKTAVIHSKDIGKNCSIGEFAVIDEHVTIGDNVRIGAHAVLRGKVIIGDNSVIGAGAVIGSTGFGFYHNQEGHMERVPHFGAVVIGKYVEIGDNTCIECGTMDDTTIGDYSKIDSLCYVAHNVRIGKDVMMIGGCSVCGSCTIGDGSYIGPNVCIKNQIHIGKNAFVGMQTSVIKDVADEESVRGVPGEVYERKYRI